MEAVVRPGVDGPKRGCFDLGMAGDLAACRLISVDVGLQRREQLVLVVVVSRFQPRHFGGDHFEHLVLLLCEHHLLVLVDLLLR